MKILFLCTGNSCRSQMAEGWAKKRWPQHQFESAGIEAHGLNYRAVRVMAEAGIDISGHASKRLGELPDQDFDIVITVCGHAHETCPLFPGSTKVIHIGFEDPPKLAAGATTEEEALKPFRQVRDQIKATINDLENLITTSAKP